MEEQDNAMNPTDATPETGAAPAEEQAAPAEAPASEEATPMEGTPSEGGEEQSSM